MTSYLRSWLLGAPTDVQNTNTPQTIIEPPDIEVIEPQEEDEPNSDDGYDTDRPPAFPAINSPQRAAATSREIGNTPTRGLMAPPPPRSSLSPQALRLGDQSSADSSGNLAPLATTKVAKKPKKVMLAPGHSTLDWANLKSSGADLRVSLFEYLKYHMRGDSLRYTDGLF